MLLFDANAQAAVPAAAVSDFYEDLRRRLAGIPGVRNVTLSHASLIRAGSGYRIRINGQPAVLDRDTRILLAGPEFFATMQIPVTTGRDITDRDLHAGQPVAVISQRFARANFGDSSAIGRYLEVNVSSLRTVEIVGVATDAWYGPLREAPPPVVYFPYTKAQLPSPGQMTYALRTDGNPLDYVPAVHQAGRDADSRVPIARR